MKQCFGVPQPHVQCFFNDRSVMLVFHLNILMLGIDSEAKYRFLMIIIIRKFCSIKMNLKYLAIIFLI